MRASARARTVTLRSSGVIGGIIGLCVVSASMVPAGAATPGTRLWTTTYDGPASGRDVAADVAVDPAGTAIFVTGGSVGNGTGADFLTRAYDPSTGGKLWTNRYDGPAHFNDDAQSVAVSPDGATVFVTGESSATTDPDNYDYATIALDAASGAQLWVRRYDGPSHSNDAAFGMSLSPDGQAVYVTGTSLSFTTSFDFVTLAYDASTGATLWKKRYDDPSSGIDEAYAITVQPDGSRVFVTGQSSSPNVYDMETIAYDAATGATDWKKRVDGPAHDLDYAMALTIDPAGSRLFVTGTTSGGSTRRDYTTIAYDPATGAPLWTTRWAGPYDGDDVAETITVSPDGSRVVVGGFLQFIAYDAATGTQQWNETLSSVDEARSIVTTPDGSTVIATGYNGKTVDTLGAVALDGATGSRVWARSVSGTGTGDGHGTSIVVSPDGTTAFATGTLDDTGTGSDYVTVAYAV